jgi:hypothetical protein
MGSLRWWYNQAVEVQAVPLSTALPFVNKKSDKPNSASPTVI